MPRVFGVLGILVLMVSLAACASSPKGGCTEMCSGGCMAAKTDSEPKKCCMADGKAMKGDKKSDSCGCCMKGGDSKGEGHQH